MSFSLHDAGISRSLLLVGDREREHRYMLKNTIKPNWKILDLGANIGYYVLMELRLMNNTGHIIAIEPEPNNFKLLRRNISLNNMDPCVTTINAAVSDQDGTAPLYLSHLGNVHSLKQKQTTQYSGHSISVKALSLATIAKQHPDINLIRMDIEGYEQEVLTSLITINQQTTFLPQILFELHSVKYDHPRFQKLLADLWQIGYRAKFIASSHLDLLLRHKLQILASLPTDGTVRHIAASPSREALTDLYPHSRAVLLTAD